MPSGTVKFFNDQKGFGFIAADDGSGDTFVHATAVERAGWRGLEQNQRLSYDIVVGDRGKSQAANLKSLEEGEADQAAAPGQAATAE